MKIPFLIAALLISPPAMACDIHEQNNRITQRLLEQTERIQERSRQMLNNYLNSNGEPSREYVKPHAPDYRNEVHIDEPSAKVRHLHGTSGAWLGYIVTEGKEQNLFSPAGLWLGNIGGK